MDRNIVTLQLTVPALEKIFEGNPEFVISIRQAAIAEFARRKIGDIMEKSLKADVEAAVAKQVGTVTNPGGYNQKITLQKPILEAIQGEALKTLDAHKKAIDKMIQEMADRTIQTQIKEIDQMVKREVERRVTAEISTRVTAEVKAKMNEVIKAAQL